MSDTLTHTTGTDAVRTLCTEQTHLPWASDLHRALGELPTTPTGTLRSWMDDHKGATVHTVQVEQTGRVRWVPGPRVIDSVRPSFATLNGSRIYFAGSPVVVADGAAVVIRHDDMGTFMVYAVFATS
jgi:hypothetical protein